MADAFDDWLGSSLVAPERLPDRRFVAGVQARIALEEQLAAEDRAVLARLASQLAALIAVAVALWIVGRAAPVADWFAHSPLAGTLMLAAVGGFVVLVLGTAGGSSEDGITTA